MGCQEFHNHLLQELHLLESNQEKVLLHLVAQKRKLSKLVAAIPPHILEAATNPPPSLSNIKEPKDQKKSQKSKKTSSKTKPASPVNDQPPVQIEEPKLVTCIEPISKEEFARIPSYVVGRNTVDRLNVMVSDLNVLLNGTILSHLISHHVDKSKILNIPEHKLKAFQKEVVYDFKNAQTNETFRTIFKSERYLPIGRFFFTEKELKEKPVWTNSKFNYSAQCRNLLTVLRTLGKIKEVRGGGSTRFVLI